MQVDGNDMIDAGNREEIGYQTCGDGASVGLFFRLSGVEKVWHHSSDALGGAALASRDHNEHFHKAIVNVVTTTLDDEDILVSDRRLKADRGFTVTKLLQLDIGW